MELTKQRAVLLGASALSVAAAVALICFEFRENQLDYIADRMLSTTVSQFQHLELAGITPAQLDRPLSEVVNNIAGVGSKVWWLEPDNGVVDYTISSTTEDGVPTWHMAFTTANKSLCERLEPLFKRYQKNPFDPEEMPHPRLKWGSELRGNVHDCMPVDESMAYKIDFYLKVGTWTPKHEEDGQRTAGADRATGVERSVMHQVAVQAP
jgi:hypothetical protein